MAQVGEGAAARLVRPQQFRQRVTGVDSISLGNNVGIGTLAGTPVIPKGTNGILGTGAIEKRVVVVEDPDTGTDSMAIRKRSIFTLGYDHRMVDGADAARFLARLKDLMETFPEDA